MINLIFYCQPQNTIIPKKTPNEMQLVLYILAIGSILVGFLGLPHLLEVVGLQNLFANYFESFFTTKIQNSASIQEELIIIALSGFLAFLGMFIMYRRHYQKKFSATSKPNLLKQFIINKFYIESIYNLVIIKPLKKISQYIFLNLFEGVLFKTDFVKLSANFLGRKTSNWHNGNFFRYSITIFLATVLISYLILT